MRTLGILLKNAAVVIAGALFASILAAQETLQFNVPYHCPDGTDNIITRCETNARGGTICVWRTEKNGQLVGERFNIRSQMDGWLKVCKVRGAQAGKPGAAPGQATQPVGSASQAGQPGKALNPPYLSEMPSVEEVKREIQGSSPDDTLARQVAVFVYLPHIVERRKDPSRKYGDVTDDETRIMGAYNLAAYEMSQAYAKSHTPEETKKFEFAHGKYEMDSEFYKLWFNKLFSEEFRAGYGGVQTANAAHAKAHFDAERQVYDNAKAQQAAVAINAAKPKTVTPGGSEELRRCIASGRSQRLCFSEVMGTGMDQLTGISTKLPSTPGLRMTGDYSSAAGLRVIFQPAKAVITCRGVSSPLPYAVEVSDAQALVKIQNGGKPVVFAMRQDGKLEASGPIRITGIMPAGSRTEQTMGTTTRTTTTQRELTPLEARNYPDAKQNGQVFTNTETSTESSYGPTGTRRVEQYATKTVDCNLGLMNPTGPTPLPPDVENPMGLLTMIASGTATLMKGGSMDKAVGDMMGTDKAPAPGLRMSGKYAGTSGFSITFHPESATVACGDAELAHEYVIQKNANQIFLKIQDKANPITLQLKPDGSLFADGTVQVNGRVIVGTTEDPNNPYVFAPKVGSCPVGSLVSAK